MLTHRSEVPSVPDKSRFVGLYLDREAYSWSGWAIVSVTVDHAARLLSFTRGSISVFTHLSCEVGTWFGSSMGVMSDLLNWDPSKTPAGTG